MPPFDGQTTAPLAGTPDGRDCVAIRRPGGTLLIGSVAALPFISANAASAAGALMQVRALAHGTAVDPLVSVQLRRLAPRLGVQAPRGVLDDAALIAAVAAQVERGSARALWLPDSTGSRLVERGMTAPPPPPMAGGRAPAIGSLSAFDRVTMMLRQVPPYLRDDLRAAFLEMISPTSLAFIAGALLALAAAQAVGWGEVADVVIAAWAYSVAGLAGLWATVDLFRAVATAARADSAQDIDAAARRAAAALNVLSLSVLTLLLARRVSGGASAGSDAAAASPGAPPRPPPSRGAPPPRAAPTAPVTAEELIGEKPPASPLIDPIAGLTADEQSFLAELKALGHDVKVVPTGIGRTPDFIIDGIPTELKTLSGVAKTTPDALSSALSSRIMDARGQAAQIIVDARKQVGMTQAIAERGIGRAIGADNALGSKIKSVTVLVKDGQAAFKRL